MEAYTLHRSRSRAAFGAQRPPPPASFSSKKPYASGNGYTAYNDVFGGPPKFGAAPPFAPRAEDYMEIFGSFLSSRASSIPILDLPPVDDSVSAFDFAGSGCDYSDVFGGLEFADFAVPYDELFRRSDGVNDSSDEAWISTASEESDPSCNSERNQCFRNSNFHQPAESSQFNVSHHQVNTGMEDSSCTRVAQVSAVPGYTYVVCGSTSLEHEDEESRSSGMMDSIILREDLSGNISFETLDRSFSDPSHDFSSQHFYEPDLRTGRTDCASNYFLDPIVEHVTDIDIGSNISEMGKHSKPPPNLVRRLETLGNCSNLRNCAYEKKAESGSLPLSDVDVDVSPSALASVEAMKEAMQRAELKMKSAKESMERNKDGCNGAKPSMKNEISDGVKASIPCDESVVKSDVLLSKSPMDYKEIKNQARTISDSFETVLPSHDYLQAGQASSATVKPSQKNVTKDHSPSSMDSGSVGEEDDEWKEASQYFELVNHVNIQKEPHLVDNSNTVEHELNSYHVVNDIGRHMAVEQQHRDDRVVGSSSSSQEAGGDEDSDLFEEDLEPRKTRPRLRAIKAASRQDFHQKMVKVAQEFHERVMPNHVDAENEVKRGWKRDGSEGKTETCFQVNELTNGGTAQDLGPCRNHEEAPSNVRTTNNSKEAKLADCGDGKEVFKGVQEGSGMKEAYARRENGVSMKVPPPEKENTTIVKKEIQSEVKKGYCAPKEKRGKEKACQSDENCSGDSIIFELEEDIAKDGRGQLQQRSKSLEEADSTLMEMDKEVSAGEFMQQPNENLRMEQLEESNKEDTVASRCYETEKDSIVQEELKKHEMPLVYDFTAESKVLGVALKSCNNLESCIFEVESLSCRDHVEFGLKSDVKECEKVSDNAGKNSDQQEGFGGQVLNDLQSDVEKSNNLPRTKKHVEAQQFASANESPRTNGENAEFSQVTHGSEELGSLNSSSPDVNGKRNSEMASRCEVEMSSNASQKTCENEGIGECKTQPLVVEDELKAAERVDCPVSMENVHPQKVAKPVMPERKESIQNRSKPMTATQRLGQEGSVSNGSLIGEESGRRAERLNRERELEEERLRKVEEEREREREREKDRMGVELGFGERAFAEACGRVDKTAMDKATAEARQRAMAEARERLEKACAEARGKSISDKSAAAEAARLKAERAAVERATAEARERAVEKAKVERERLGRSVSDNITTRYSSLSSEFDGTEGETAERCKARLERHRRTVERVAKALAEKNMRDLIAQREQAERNRFAETLDADIKRWSSGKEGNLRALLSTLQYILGPDSGWQPIPLTEVITSAAVKKAYRKATLCVHPDKLQQRGATIPQKYVCEKVFDLLKDGWNKFNSEER